MISNMFLRLGERERYDLHNRMPDLYLAKAQYPKLLDALKRIIRYLTTTVKKQQHCESMEMIPSVLSGLAARCNLGTLERIITRTFYRQSVKQ